MMQYALGVHRIKQQTAVAAFPSIAFTIFFGDGLTLCYSRASPNVLKGGKGGRRGGRLSVERAEMEESAMEAAIRTAWLASSS